MKKFLSLFAAILFAGSMMAADPVTVKSTFTKATAPSDGVVTDLEGEVTWSIATEVGAGTPSYTTGKNTQIECLKFGSKAAEYFSKVTLSTNYYEDYNVKSVTLYVLNNGKKTGTLTVKQGETTIGTASEEFGTTWTALTATGVTGNGGTLEVSYEVAQASYWSYIEVQYETSQGGEGPVVEPTTKTIYCSPFSEWHNDGARFAVYALGDGENTAWYDLVAVEGAENVYSAEIAEAFPMVIFCRMNGETTENNWDNKWNQTADLALPTDGKNLYTITGWNENDGTWSVYTAQGGDDPEPVDPTPTEKDSIYFVNVAGWAAPRVHLWGGTAAGTEWPGVEMTKLEDQINNYDVYKYVADKGAYVKCIFSDNGENQTADLDWTSGKYFYNDAWYAQNEIPAPVEPQPVDSMTVYYVNETAWENVDAFVWPAEGEAYKAWPGEAMTKEAEQINGFDVYSYTFPASYVNIIFNNGNSGEGNQTSDLVWEEAKPYFYGGAWYAKAGIPTGGDPQEEEFVGFDARTENLGEQIAAGLAKNLVNVTFEETSTGKYSVNLVEGGVEGSFSFGGVIFAYTNSNAGTTAYKTFGTYIQPNGKDREVRIPLNAGEKANVILTEACEGVLVNGVSTDLVSGDNILTATEDGLVLKTVSTKPKIQAILPVAEPVDSMTVYYVNETAWENVDAFVWPAEGEAYKAWPGEAMTKEAEQINGFDVYSYTFPASYVNIIFNNGNSGEGNQTSDLVWEEAKPYFYGGAWYAKAGIPTGGDPQVEEFVGFDARTTNLGEQIAAGLAKNLVNVTFEETAAGKYSVNLVEGGVEGSFSFGGVIFAYTNSNAGTTAYKTFGTYIQPNGKDREVRIPLNAGEKANVILTEACEGVLVNGVSTDLVSGDNILTATEEGLVLKTVSTKPKIQAVLPVEPQPVDSMTVYYVNETAWENVDAFVWPAEGEAYKAWPGEAMTKEAEQINGFDVYSYTFPASYVNIIFNNGNSGEGNQTTDLVWEAAKPYFYDGAWYASLEAIPAPEAPAKFYVTGDSALIADAAPAGTVAWASNAIKSENDTLVLNLKAGVDYQLSLTVDGTWNTKKTYADLTLEDKSGLYDVDGDNHNIGFKLNEPGEVKVVYFVKDEVVTFELIGNFYVAPVDPQEEVTVYFVNTPRWDGVNIYLWNNETFENNAAWPGLAMTKEETKVQGFDVYSYTFVNSKNFDKCIFNHIDQTADLELHAGQYYCVDTWYESIEAIPELDIDEPSPIDPTTAHFYIKHAGNNWTWVEMTYDAVMDAFTYQSVWAGNGANINTVGEDNGNAWYPAAMINVAEDVELRDTVLFAYNYNTKALSVTLVGKYVQKLANGYYIIGLNGWTVDDLSESDDLFYSTGIETGEFSLETTLTEGAVFKVVRVEGDAIINWYGIQTSEQNPDGNYIVDAAHAGEKTIYFRPEWNEDWAGHIYVEPNETTAISNTAADAEAVKVLHNGMLLIRKGNKTYNIMGQSVK